MAEERPQSDAARALDVWRRDGLPAEDVHERVRTRAMEEIVRRKAGRRTAWLVAAPVLAAAAALLAWLGAMRGGAGESRVLAARRASTRQGPVGVGDRAPRGPIDVQAGGELAMSLPHGRVATNGPSSIEIEAGRVFVHSGTLDARGQVPFEGSGCSGEVHGHAQLTAARTHMHVTVFAGSVERNAPEIACDVEDLPAVAPAVGQTPNAARTPSRMRESHEPVEPPAYVDLGATAPVPPSSEVVRDAPPAAPTDSTRNRVATTRAVVEATPSPVLPLAIDGQLREQGAAYRHAMSLRGRDDVAALRELEEIRARWPEGTFAHEVRYTIVAELLRLDQRDRARAEARAFLARYPSSPHADAVRHAAGLDDATRERSP